MQKAQIYGCFVRLLQLFFQENGKIYYRPYRTSVALAPLES